MFRQAEEAGFGVTGLRAWSESADFYKSEAQRCPRVHCGGRLVHASGETERIREVETQARDGVRVSVPHGAQQAQAMGCDHGFHR
jgi:hypothetical protein